MACVVIIACASCGDRDTPDRSANTARPDSSVTTTRRAPHLAAPDTSVPLIAVASDDQRIARLVAIDSSFVSGRAASVDLFAHGASTAAVITAMPDAPGCARVSPDSSANARTWLLAFSTGAARQIAVDSLSTLRARDSLRLTIAVAALASRVVADTDATFRGLPYVVTGAWWFSADSARTVMVATTVRDLALEADPRAEVVLLVAEREGPRADWGLRLGTRASGPEASITRPEFRGAVTLTRPARLAVIVERATDGMSEIELYERATDAGWSRRWSRPVVACGN